MQARASADRKWKSLFEVMELLLSTIVSALLRAMCQVLAPPEPHPASAAGRTAFVEPTDAHAPPAHSTIR